MFACCCRLGEGLPSPTHPFPTAIWGRELLCQKSSCVSVALFYDSLTRPKQISQGWPFSPPKRVTEFGAVDRFALLMCKEHRAYHKEGSRSTVPPCLADNDLL